MNSFPIRTIFYSITKTENDFGEVIKTPTVSFATGTRPVTSSFKESMQRELRISGNRQFVNARKSPNTLAVEVGDHVEMPSVSNKTFEVIAIDPKFTNRGQIMFLIDELETE